MKKIKKVKILGEFVDVGSIRFFYLLELIDKLNGVYKSINNR